MNNDMENYLRAAQFQLYTIADQSSAAFNAGHHATADKQLVHQLPLSPEQLREKLRKQLEYYFSKENIINDIYLQSQMDADNYVPISMIGNFKLVKRLTHDLRLITDVLKESPLVEVDSEERKVRSSDSKMHLPSRKRCIIILRNVPLDATETEILGLFINDTCPVAAIGCERVLESDHSDCWYVTFNSEDDAQNAFLYLTRENISIRGQKVLARMKACLWQKPPMPSSDGLTTTTIPAKSSAQEPYPPVYLQSTPANHSNSSPFLRNLSQQQTIVNYHPTQLLQQQRAHLPLNYNVNMLPHQHAIPTTLPFTANPQQINLNYYPQAHFVNRNHHVFPTNFWYIPSTLDSYSPMLIPLNSLIRTYNGIHKPKTRLSAPKFRNNSTKPTSNHEGTSTANTNPLTSSQHNTPQLEDHHSTVSPADTPIDLVTDSNTSADAHPSNGSLDDSISNLDALKTEVVTTTDGSSSGYHHE